MNYTATHSRRQCHDVIILNNEYQRIQHGITLFVYHYQVGEMALCLRHYAVHEYVSSALRRCLL